MVKEGLVGREIEYICWFGSEYISRETAAQYRAVILRHVGDVLAGTDFWAGPALTPVWLRGGLRFSYDQSLIEGATAACGTYADLVAQQNSMHYILDAVRRASVETLRHKPYNHQGPIEVFAHSVVGDPGEKNPRAPREATVGCHENYLLRFDLFEELGANSVPIIGERIFMNLGLAFAALPVLAGSGHINSLYQFVLSPRMAWMHTSIGGVTTSERSMVNTRDEAHMEPFSKGIPRRFFRYHHIMADSNCTDRMIRMRTAFTYWLLRLVERGWTVRPEFSAYAEKWTQFEALVRNINCDPKLENRYDISGGNGKQKGLSAVDILEYYLQEVDSRRRELLFDAEDELAFHEVTEYLEAARRGPQALNGWSEWATKYCLMKWMVERKHLSDLSHPELRAMSTWFHCINQDSAENKFLRIRNKVLPPNQYPASIQDAARRAPCTRDALRGLIIYCAKRYRVPVTFLNWNKANINRDPALGGSCEFQWGYEEPWRFSSVDVKEFMALARPWLPGGCRYGMPPDVEPSAPTVETTEY